MKFKRACQCARQQATLGVTGKLEAVGHLLAVHA